VIFEVGDYVIRKVDPDFIWQVACVPERTPPKERHLLELLPVCTLEGKPVCDTSIKQRVWNEDLEEAPAMLVIAWESR